MNFLPSAVTLLNLCFGCLSLISTFNHNFHIAALLILASMVMDAADGRVARKLNVSSDLGKELDSLADLVSFGVAPSLLIWGMNQNPIPAISWGGQIMVAVCIIFILCGAFRLARFNVLNINDHFVGVPITIAGSLVALIALAVPQLSGLVFMIILLLLAYLMICKITVPKL